MAVVYDRVKGMPIQELIAHQQDVQNDLSKRAKVMGTKAEWLLAGHRAEGHARIMVEEGDIDRHIILDDTRGVLAAMSIEYGRKGGDDGAGAMEGLFILHHATGLPRRQ